MREVDYLKGYYPFDDDILGRVEREVDHQHNLSWPEYVRRFDIPDPKIYRPRDGKPIEVLDIAPKDYDNVLVYHQPMGCVLDSNISLHVATLAAVENQKRIIAVGNPGQPGRDYGKLSILNSYKVLRDDFRPVVAPTLEFLESRGVESAQHAGESYAADKTAAAAEHAHFYDSSVSEAIMVEPVSVVKAGLPKMVRTFAATGKHSAKYLQPVRDQSQTFESAEELRKYSMIGYGLGLARLSNLAIAAGLGKQGFEGRVERALVISPRLKTGIAWATASEFDLDNERNRIVKRLTNTFGEDRVEAMPLKDQTHAMNLDIFLNAAIIAQLLKRIKAKNRA